MAARALPYQHLSVRVAWHDTDWTGKICADPVNNGSCLRLQRIAGERRDGLEMSRAGTAWAALANDELPPCHAERAGFMSPAKRRVLKSHPYAEWNEVYKKFEPVWIDLPAYSADCVPFRWMLREHAVELAGALELDYDARLEEKVDAEAGLNSPAWIQHERNQRTMLDTFFSAVHPSASLVFFYAKETPLSDDPRRVLLGVGRVTGKEPSKPYGNRAGGFGSVTWETPIEHSVRPTMEDGFLLPYHHLLELGRQGVLDPAEFVIHVPDEYSTQFSYATEHVGHDCALSLLLALVDRVDKVATVVPGNWERVRTWLSERIAEVWNARGAFPGLGAALTAFGMDQGVLLSYAIRARATDRDNPWDMADRVFREPDSYPDLKPRPGEMLRKVWVALPHRRRELLELLSRFDLTIDQAKRLYVDAERVKAGLALSDADVIANPYRIFEADRSRPDPVPLSTVDRGAFPVDSLRDAFPLPAASRVDDPLDGRRIRALTVDELERAAAAGHSVVAQTRLIQQVRDAPLDPPCPLSNDIMAVAEATFAPEVVRVSMADGSGAYQLTRLHDARDKIGALVRKRMAAKPLPVDVDWATVIAELLKGAAQNDPDEPLAREEKQAALQVLAQSRISVLIGPAGTGKTTLLKALCGLPGVADRGILLLAPTGKSRVRMQTAIKRPALTLAQLLVDSGRYDPETGRYQRSEQRRRSGVATVIVDECSMLTEEQLDALLDGIEGFDRLIFVGDPRQLPPIGVGRPFVDIVEHIRAQRSIGGFPKVGPSYAELTVKRRQIATGAGDAERPDLVLADWFAGAEVAASADSIWDELRRQPDLGTLAVRQWKTPHELHRLLQDELAASLEQMGGADDHLGFQASYGGNVNGDYVYFNIGSAQRAEAWQVLSPIRSEGGGVNELNRLLQRTYRASVRELANETTPYKRKIPKPAGPQEIVYGDKVINVRNGRRKWFWPENDDALAYVANGEIGVMVGPFRRKGQRVPLDRFEVEFSTQQGVAYRFWPSELGGDDSSPVLELAYAITVHKAQGSEFGTTFVIVPNPCRLLSRELLYTALTRQQHRVVLFLQGELEQLRDYASPKFSEAAGRVTNLFADPRPIEVDGKWMEEKLIHHTRKGIFVRSKSEVIIADLLYSKGIDYVYERELVVDGSMRLPDFTIEDSDTGETYYWEHLGMLNSASYRRKWDEKLAWYRARGIHPRGTNAGEDPEGTLIITKDGPDGSISSAEIESLVDHVFLGK